MEDILMFIAEVLFAILLGASAFFYVFYSFKKQPNKKKWMEVAILGIIFISEITSLTLGSIWQYLLAIAALVLFVDKISKMIPKKKA